MEACICQGIKNIEGNSDFLSPNYENYETYILFMFTSRNSYKKNEKANYYFLFPNSDLFFLYHVILN